MKKKNTLGNRIILPVMLLMTIGMLFLTGWIRGWLDTPEVTEPQITENQGTVYLKRYGIGFRPGESLHLRDGDTLLTGKDATVKASAGSAAFRLHPETELTFLDFGINSGKQDDKAVKNGTLALRLTEGTVFLHGGKRSMLLEAAGETITLESADALLELGDDGIPSLLLFSGSCDREDLMRNVSLQELTMDTLKDLNSLPQQTELMFDREDLAKETAQRERARQQELQKKLSEGLDLSEDAHVCSITIRCDSLLKHMDQVNREKKPYIPEDGEILRPISVNFEEGDTVLDVLERVCTAGEIPLEYNYTPAYKSYYIEGINHLYEFDCGPASGWTYMVNGTYPNYGCSSFVLQDGDEISWIFTADGESPS